MSRIGAIVVSHRTPVRAERCAHSLRGAGADVVLVVDAGSDDGTVARLRAAGIDVLAEANLGFGRCANAGVAHLPEDVDAVVVCNADTTWAADAVPRLASAVRTPGVAAAGPRVVYPDGRPQASARRLPSLPTALGHAVFGLWWPDNRWTRRYRALDDTVDVSREVDWLSGCALAVDRAAFTAVGGFDPAYFLYAEDVDLGLRLGRLGRLVTVVEARVVHEVGASTTALSTRRVLHHARGLDRFASRHVLTGWRRRLRPLVRLGLLAWTIVSVAWERTTGRRSGRSTTGE